MKKKNRAWEIIQFILPIIISVFISYFIFNKQFNADEKNRLNENLNKLLDINLQYPYVEDSLFIARWNENKNSNNDSSLRYQAYCEYAFNFLQNVSEYFNYNKSKIQSFVDMKDLIDQHKDWINMPEQKGAYPKEFFEFINKFNEK